LLVEAVQLVSQLALALEYVRSQGAPQRTIQPGSIIMKPLQTGNLPYLPVITDLGMAGLADRDTAETRSVNDLPTSSLAAAPAYLSPEEILGRATDARSDVFRLGVLLFQLATGQLPFPIQTFNDAVNYASGQPSTPPRSIRPDLPEPLSQAINQALEKNPEQRFPSPAALSAELENLLPSVEGVITAPPGLNRAVSLLIPYRQSLSGERGAATFEQTLPPPDDLTTIRSGLGPGPVDVILENAQLSVEPGSSVSTRVILLNRGLSEGFFRLSVEGAPANWVAITPQIIQFSPGEQKEANLTIQPIRSPLSRAGRYPLTLRAINQQDPAQFGETKATLTVTAFSRFGSRLYTPSLRTGETGQIAVNNQGNTQNMFTITFGDPQGELYFTPPQAQLRLAEGQTGVAEFRADLQQARWIGSEKSHTFSAAVSSSAGETQTHTGEVISRALLPAWLVGAALLLLLCLIGSVGLVFSQSGIQASRATQTAYAVQTSTALVVDAVAQAQTATAQSLVNANLATINAVTATAAVQQATQTAAVLTVTAAATQAAQATQTSDAATQIAAGANAQTATSAAGTAQFFGTQTASAQAVAGATSSAATALAATLNAQNAAATAQAQAAAATANAGTALASTAAAQTAQAATAVAAAQIATASAQTATAAAVQAATAAAATAQFSAAQTATAQAAADIAATQTAAGLTRVAFVYAADTTAAQDYKNLLQGNGFLVDLVAQNVITSTDFSPYQAILAGPDTGSQGNWGDSAGDQANRLMSSGTRIMGLGEGGYALFGKLRLAIGYNQGDIMQGNSVIAVDPGSPIWSQPNQIGIPGDNIVTLYNNPVTLAAIKISLPSVQGPLLGLTFIGQLPQATDHYPIIRQRAEFMLWGFSGSPVAMSTAGQQFFVNVLRALLP
jgi:serine/threonine protein kinase